MPHTLFINSRVIPADLETPVGIYLKIRDLYPQSALLSLIHISEPTRL